MPIVPRDDCIHGAHNFLIARDCAHIFSARRCIILIHILRAEGHRIVCKLEFDAFAFSAIIPAEILSRQAGKTESSFLASTTAKGSSACMAYIPSRVTTEVLALHASS